MSTWRYFVLGLACVSLAPCAFPELAEQNDRALGAFQDVLDDRAFSGTATPYIPGDPAAATLMYAYKVWRNCGNQTKCVTLGIADCSRLTRWYENGSRSLRSHVSRAWNEGTTRYAGNSI